MAVLEQLQDVELVVVVLQVSLVECGIPMLTTFTPDMSLQTTDYYRLLGEITRKITRAKTMNQSTTDYWERLLEILQGLKL